MSKPDECFLKYTVPTIIREANNPVPTAEILQRGGGANLGYEIDTRGCPPKYTPGSTLKGSFSYLTKKGDGSYPVTT